jgi:hypothetical protein
MQALRLASQSLLHARIDSGALCVLRGDCQVYTSRLLLGHRYNWSREGGVERLCHVDCVGCGYATLQLDPHRAVLALDCFELQLRKTQDARVARWIAQRVCGAQHHVFSQFVDDLDRVIRA